MIGVTPSGPGIWTRPVQLVTDRVWKGPAFAARAGASTCQKIVDLSMDGKINMDDLITHTTPLDKIDGAFELMHQAKSIRSVVAY